MKKRHLLILATLSFLVILPACKKGENDPFLSLTSRKNRLVGNYLIESWEASAKTTSEYFGNTEMYLTLTQNGGTEKTITSEGEGGENSTTTSNEIIVKSALYSFSENGTFDYLLDYEVISSKEINFGMVERYEYRKVVVNNFSGNWNFLHREPGGEKNKECLALNYLNSSFSTINYQTTIYTDGSSLVETLDSTQSKFTSADNENSEIYLIDRLAKDETILIRTSQGQTTITMEDSGEEFIVDNNSTRELKIHLTKK